MLFSNQYIDIRMNYFVVKFWTVTCLGLVFCKELDEKRLHHDLFGNDKYKKVIRPTMDDSILLTVNLGLRLSQLLDMDEKNQIMTSSVWLHQEWFDNRLKWEPKEYGGLKLTHVPSSEIWRPDIVLYNNADGDFEVQLLTKAKVEYTGHITWEPPVIYKSYCPIDIEFFPFDIQECFLKFGVWSYGIEEVDLQHMCSDKAIYINETEEEVIDRGIDITSVYPNAEWDIINVTARRREKMYPCCGDQLFIDITFNVTFRRRILFYSLNLIMPCVSISGLAVLVFYLPSDSCEKITLSISVLLALSVFFLLLSDIMPPTSLVVPLIGKYLLFTMSVVTLSIFLSVYTIGVNFRRPSTTWMSPWVKSVFTEVLPRILFIKRPSVHFSNNILDKQLKPCKLNGINQTYISTSAPTYPDDDSMESETELDEIKDITYSKEMTLAFEGVKYIAHTMKDEETEVSIERDWKFIAMVMDRLFLYIFATACICGTISLLLYAPSLYDDRPALSKLAPRDSCSF